MNEFGASPIAGASGLRDDGLGLWCDAGGAFLGGVPLLIARRQTDGSIRFSPRREDEIARLLHSAYGARFDGNTRMGGLRAVANGLNAGQECRAIIAALHMRLPSLTPLAKIMIERAERLIKAEWDESKHPRQPAGIPEGGQFAPAGGGGAATRPRADRDSAEVDMTEGGMAPPRTLTAEERAAAERILRDLESYAQTSAEALGRMPEDVARLIEQFKRDPVGALRSLGPSLSGINVALSPESLAAARALVAARGVGSTAETALPETYAPPEATAKDPVGRRGSPIMPAAKRNPPEGIAGREYSGHALDMMQARGYTPSAVEEAIATGRRSPGNKPGTSTYIDGKNGVKVIVADRSGRVVTVSPTDIVKFVMKGRIMTEAERRLYEVIRQWIRDYDAHRMDLVRLASELLGLVPHLAAFDKPWAVRFEQIAFDLEVLVAVALDNEQTDLTDEEYRELDRGLNALDALIDEKLGPRA